MYISHYSSCECKGETSKLINLLPVFTFLMSHVVSSIPLISSQPPSDAARSSSPPRWPFSVKTGGHLDTPSGIQIYTYNKDDYLMLSSDGALSVCNDEYEYMTLDRWEEEYTNNQKITCIPFFARFKKWESFYVWRTKVRSKKVNQVRIFLKERLFAVSQV